MNPMEWRFFGACEQVTGSCHIIKSQDKTILIDCGLYQGNQNTERQNSHPFPIDIRTIDAVILSHAHLDHSGRLPLLTKAGFTGPIYAHPATIDLVEILLMDAGFLNERDCDTLNKKRARKHLPKLLPLYDTNDVKKTLRQFQAIAYENPFRLANDLSFCLYDAGHILGSSIVELTVEAHQIEKRIVFSGDLGNQGAPLLKDPTPLQRADLIVLESTYGDRQHKSWEDTWEELKQAIHSASSSKSNILIPAFTVGRTQELLFTFKKNFNHWQLERWHFFLDSPMAIEATKVYAKHWKLYDKQTRINVERLGSPYALKNLHLCPNSQDSMHLNRIQSGAIIIAGSGMCNGGRMLHHLKHNIWKRNCHIIFVGYQAKGTLGRRIIDGAKSISLWGERINVAAQIHTIGGLSAHADQAGLIAWLNHFKDSPPVMLVHGETTAMQALKAKIELTFTNKVQIAKKGQVINLNHL